MSVVSSLIAPHVMCTAQKSAHRRDTNAVPLASNHWAGFSWPWGFGRDPIG